MAPNPKRRAYAVPQDAAEVLPERLVLSNEAFDALSARILNPREPNAALRALFKR